MSKKLKKSEINEFECVLITLKHKISQARFSAKVLKNRTTTLDDLVGVQNSLDDLRRSINETF